MKDSLGRLVDVLTSLPGIGRKSAQRIAFHLLKNPDNGKVLVAAVESAINQLHLCPLCFNFTEDALCPICADKKRDHSTICVVEEPQDVFVLEQTGEHRGTYHVLGGVLSPLDNVGPESLHIKELVERVRREKIVEIIVATNPTVEGEATANYIAQLLKPLGVRVSRIARGIPVGGDLELADRETISRAFEGRREL
ncbi:MAG: recombination mediator RecR [candidate division WOR-3 bacterium]